MKSTKQEKRRNKRREETREESKQEKRRNKRRAQNKRREETREEKNQEKREEKRREEKSLFLPCLTIAWRIKGVLGLWFESARARFFLFILLNALPVPMLRQVF